MRSILRRSFLTLTLTFTLTFTYALLLSAAALPAQPLLEPLHGIAPRTGLPEFVLREAAVRVDASLLGGESGVAELELDLFGEKTLRTVRQRTERNRSGSLTWIGTVTDDPMGSVFLVARDGIVHGVVRAAGRLFELRRVDARYQVLQEIDESSPLLEEQEPETVTLEPSTAAPPALGADDGSRIDVLVVYTPGAMTSAGGTPADIESRIELGIAETNTSYGNSGIDTSMWLVGIEPVAYTESGNMQTDRNRLRINGDGFLDEVHPWRDAYGADIVHMIIANPGCGIAYIMSPVDPAFEEFAFCVTREACISPNHTFPHEMGHLQSARHDWATDGTKNSPFSYNHGFNDGPTNVWRTIMSYDTCGGGPCTRQLYWSNPDVIHPVTATPMGIPEGQPQAADNRKTLNNTALTVANFRQGGRIFGDGFESGDTSGWSMAVP